MTTDLQYICASLLNRKSKSCTFSRCICFFSPNHFFSPPLSLHPLSFISHTEVIMLSTLLFMLTLSIYPMTSCHLFTLPLCSPPPHPHLSVKLPFPSSLLDAAPPSSSVSPESLIWYLSGMGPINPASLCLFSPPLIRIHTGDILLLLVVGDWHSHLSNLSGIICVCVWVCVYLNEYRGWHRLEEK